ncbi:MAG TPA: ribonuclease P protein component 4 [Methanocorpusculum sp.]|nr:ribonuclease P protein component 4 [Methanocorpusculum sp.]
MAKAEKGVSIKKIAQERVDILFERAKEAKNEPELSARYISLAREMAMKQRVRLARSHRRSFCSSCHAFFVPGKNLRVRIQHGKIIYTCGICGAVTRIPLNKKPNQGEKQSQILPNHISRP